MAKREGSPSIAPSLEFKNHWWWRPGWAMGRSMLTYHVTLERQPEIARRITEYYAAALDSPVLDRVPAAWLHVTVQGLAFRDEIGEGDLQSVLRAARDEISNLDPIELSIGSTIIAQEGVVVKLTPTSGLSHLRTRLRETLTRVVGIDSLLESDSFTPHLTLAYANSTGDTRETADQLAALEPLSLAVRFDELQLIDLSRDSEMYEWTVVDRIRLVGGASTE